jgi:bifunctional UDP-N-acetylglucosamine pyrophosphorylase/glucosamine-1-phosphate N-acetyltransferase
MQAVILAAGKSSRFYPFTDLEHKSYVPLLGKKIIEHTLSELKKTGVDEVIIVIKGEKEKLSDDNSLGIKIKYVVQEEPLGMGNALLKAKGLIKGDFFLLNAYHINFSRFSDDLKNRKKSKDDLVLLLKKEKDNLDQYGIAKIDGENVLEIIEKPKDALESLRVIGIYFMPARFLDILETIPSEHYALEKAISLYAKGNKVKYFETKENTLSLKYPWDLFKFSKELFKNSKMWISDSADVSKEAIIKGEVIIDDGAKILEGACIKGPCYIGKNVVIGNNALVREYSIIDKNCVIGAFCEVKNSIILENTKIHSGFVGDSIIGSGCRIGANFCSANRRLDREKIKIEGVDTQLNSLGVIMGNFVNCGVGVSTMPGVVIGGHSLIGPSSIIMKSVKENNKYYVRFEEIVEEIND